jgi:hypothetical protein
LAISAASYGGQRPPFQLKQLLDLSFRRVRHAMDARNTI